MRDMTDTSERERGVEDVVPGEEVPSEVIDHPRETSATALQASARRRADETVRRLAEAIDWLEARAEPVTLSAVQRMSGLVPKTIYRNPEARALFEAHSTHLKAQREREEAERKRRRARSRHRTSDADASLTAPALSAPPSPGPLLALGKKQLVARLEAALAARDEACRERAELEARYAALLQEHMGCEQIILTLRAEQHRQMQYLGRYRILLEHQEHG